MYFAATIAPSSPFDTERGDDPHQSGLSQSHTDQPQPHSENQELTPVTSFQYSPQATPQFKTEDDDLSINSNSGKSIFDVEAYRLYQQLSNATAASDHKAVKKRRSKVGTITLPTTVGATTSTKSKRSRRITGSTNDREANVSTDENDAQTGVNPFRERSEVSREQYCEIPNCKRYARGDDPSFLRCRTHGGGNICLRSGCKRTAFALDFCHNHGHEIFNPSTPDKLSFQIDNTDNHENHTFSEITTCDGCHKIFSRQKAICCFETCQKPVELNNSDVYNFCDVHGRQMYFAVVESGCDVARVSDVGADSENERVGLGQKRMFKVPKFADTERFSHSKCYNQERRKCHEEGCTTASRYDGKCIKHGGKKRCHETGCETAVYIGELCRKHGGYKECDVMDCRKRARHSEYAASQYGTYLSIGGATDLERVFGSKFAGSGLASGVNFMEVGLCDDHMFDADKSTFRIKKHHNKPTGVRKRTNRKKNKYTSKVDAKDIVNLAADSENEFKNELSEQSDIV